MATGSRPEKTGRKYPIVKPSAVRNVRTVDSVWVLISVNVRKSSEDHSVNTVSDDFKNMLYKNYRSLKSVICPVF